MIHPLPLEHGCSSRRSFRPGAWRDDFGEAGPFASKTPEPAARQFLK